jgi:hypothetical protein
MANKLRGTNLKMEDLQSMGVLKYYEFVDKLNKDIQRQNKK